MKAAKKEYEKVSFHMGARFKLNGKICKVTASSFTRVSYDTWHSRNPEENTYHTANKWTLDNMALIGLVTLLTEEDLSSNERKAAFLWLRGTFRLSAEQGAKLLCSPMRSAAIVAGAERLYGSARNILRDAEIIS
jgi:hypothetical protein